MCGISAIFNYRGGQMASPQEMQRTLDQMKARGPDGEGQWYSPKGETGLGHRRLAIIDLSADGAQPMLSSDGTKVLTFNGEIYNFRELRAELETKGRRFHSSSDSEVLLQAFEEYGEALLGKLRGMYAFAIWDQTRRALFLARDPFGIKPLYYANDGRTFRAASQVKALLAGGAIDRAPDPAGHAGFFIWGHIPDPYTLFRHIRALPAGTCMWVDKDGPDEPRAFCSIPAIIAEGEKGQSNSHRSADENQDTLRSALLDSVRHHLIADVPVGVFLSSGIDSTTLVALAAEAGGSVRTLTLGFEEFKGTENDEVPLAEKVARHYGAQHQTLWVTRQDFARETELLFAAMDQPTTDGVNSFFVSYAAAQAGLKVALSGLGGDEIFAGYPSFRQIPRMVNALGPFRSLTPLHHAWRIVSAPVLQRFSSPKYAGLLEYGGRWSGAYLLRRGMFTPWELPAILGPDMAREGWRELATLARLDDTLRPIHSPRLKISALELSWYMRHQLLRDTDWASMAHSLEIRTPLVDTTLLRSLAPLLAGLRPPLKRDLADAPSKKLPNAILNRRKTGFSIPVRNWLSEKNGVAAQASTDRGLRGWARMIYSQFSQN